MRNRSTEVFLPKSKNNQLKGTWGLADMFDFRNGNTHQKLLTDGRTMQRHNSDSEHLRKRPNFCDKCLDFEDACKIKVKDIMPEEFPNEKQLKKLLKAIKEQQNRTDNVHQSINSPKRAMKASQKASQVLRIGHRKEKMHICSHQYSSADELSLDHLTFTTMLERISGNIHQDGGRIEDVSRSTNPRFKQFGDINLQLLQMSAKAFIDQMYINRVYTSRAASSDKSTPFTDASEILRLNRDLFLQLLQDPNSLIVKHIQKVQFPKGQKEKRKLLCDSKSSESHSSAIRKYGDPESTMRIQKKNVNNHLWKKLKDRYGFSIKGSDCSGGSQIVVLQPVSKNRKHPENVFCQCSGFQSHKSFNQKGKNIKSRYFSLKEIKRKFKQAVGESRKEQNLVSFDDNRISSKRHSLRYAEMSVIRSTSSTRESTLSNDFKRMEKQQKPFSLMSCNGPEIESNKDHKSKKLNSLTRSGSKRDQVDIFEEAKRRLSERLKNVSAGEIVPRKQSLRTLEMILSSPDSPKNVLGASVPEEMKISSYSEMEKGKEVTWHTVQRTNKEVLPYGDSRFDDQLRTSYSKPHLPENTHDETEVHKNIDPAGEDLMHRGHISIPEERERVLADTADITSTGQRIETNRSPKVNGNGEGSRSADYPENHYHISSADCPSATAPEIPALQILDICKTREGHPSPVSVLEPFSPEDINSPTSTIHEQGIPLQNPTFLFYSIELFVEPCHYVQFQLDLLCNRAILTLMISYMLNLLKIL
ncbi:OLC1v1029750C3 [Oldenlandia corymbosa var. corymbosa]|uniref:OLC1v1029750C3 n=1 Tax=Oldenlandia corymbosa var. corymbosa TaxID=529605 RepID=A0AAV1CGC0_OLDCO|nr:OLC1v1029750C3 [Oldenlandia corymbosa var. corymbosa]